MSHDPKLYEICSRRKTGGPEVRHGDHSLTIALLRAEVVKQGKRDPDRHYWIEERRQDETNNQPGEKKSF